MKICLSCEGVTDTQAKRCGNCGAPLLSTDAVHYPSRRGEFDAGNPLLGTVIDGKYKLRSVLGRGGLGTVFRAQHVGSLVVVALKLLHPRFAERPEYRRALIPEARRAATVVDERCARLLDVGEGDEGVTYLAMELVEGQTLEELLQDGPLQPAHALAILAQVSAALAAVHESGLVHCDLSPRNVMVATSGDKLQVKVLDFGIARSVKIAGRDGRRGELRGFASPAFSAPELLAGGDVDARADLYSFGALAWLMLTGELPVDDSDRDAAMEAVRRGQLRDWPRVAGVPRALVRLVTRCLALDPEQRPASIDEVSRQLSSLQSGRGRRLGRFAALLTTIAAVLTLFVSGLGGVVFLRPQPGSALQVSEDRQGEALPVQHLRPDALAKLEFHYAGISPQRLVAEVLRGGAVLARARLEPEVDRSSSTLLLSVQQPGWASVVRELTRGSQQGPLELAFIVPGAAVLGVGRVCVDGRSPRLKAVFERPGVPLRKDTVLLVEAVDDVAVERVEAVIRTADRSPQTLTLPAGQRSVALGAMLAEVSPDVAPRGAGQVVVRALDRAGNVREARPLPFPMADTAVPEVLQITGPVGQRTLSLSGDRLRFRVQLSAGEPGLLLRCRHGARELRLPMPVEASDKAVSRSFDVDAVDLIDGAGEFEWQLAVVDKIGNEAEKSFPVRVVDRSPDVLLSARSDDPRRPAALVGNELVTSSQGGAFTVQVASGYDVSRARIEQDGRRLAEPAVELRATADQGAELSIAACSPGLYVIWLELQESEEDESEPIARQLRLRVLPESLEVRVPAVAGRYVPELVDVGMLRMQPGTPNATVAEGVGWRYDRALRAHIRGVCYQGERACAEVTPTAGTLLAGVPLSSGFNRLSLSLVDSLGRAVRVVDDRGAPLPLEDGRALFATFWWTNGRPRVVGERILVEHARPLRVRIEAALPFGAESRSRLRLGLGGGEWQAVSVESDERTSKIAFEVPFEAWSTAAKLSDQDRQAFADGIAAEVICYLLTPSGRSELQLMLQTTRSTLAPFRLGDHANLSPELARVRLLPVLAPDGAFDEPVPADAPPRATFRPQPPVAVRNMRDILLQDREFTVGVAVALAARVEDVDAASRSALVHAADPLGELRLETASLLPAGVGDAPSACPLSGVDFFQAWSLTRLLGAVVGDDPGLFRLPLGCELERAAYSGAVTAACSGALAHGGEVRAGAFSRTLAPNSGALVERSLTIGDVVPTGYSASFRGLDFGLCEWVFDLPFIAETKLLTRQWTSDHAVHLLRARALAEGSVEGGWDPLGLAARVGVVRGLAFGQVAGVIGESGERLQLGPEAPLPRCVPGVLRTVQLRRDGQALLARGRDPRLRVVGFRVAADAEALARMWGYR